MLNVVVVVLVGVCIVDVRVAALVMDLNVGGAFIVGIVGIHIVIVIHCAVVIVIVIIVIIIKITSIIANGVISVISIVRRNLVIMKS